ncbi:MAG: L-threonylcarbamoyladenylate synthase [Saprospiraceae bacterium]|jgi:L-threonylcarbamoyladenylate synthase
MAKDFKMAEIGMSATKAAELLMKGEVIALPTETVYGLAGNALDRKVVSEIFNIKNRPSFDPLIVHAHSIDQFKKFGLDIPEELLSLVENFWPGPLTLLIPKSDEIPDLVTSGSPLVAVRIPNHPITLSVLEALPFPVAAPSANPFGYISPTSAQHVEDQLGKKISYILDGGPCTVGIESTIVGLVNKTLTIFRKGGLSKEILQSGTSLKVKYHQIPKNTLPNLPGSISSHYAPSTKLVRGHPEDWANNPNLENIAVLAFQKHFDFLPDQHQIALSPKGDLKEAAQNLFSAMRTLDALQPDLIIAEFFPERGLGIAINDRLQRASIR